MRGVVILWNTVGVNCLFCLMSLCCWFRSTWWHVYCLSYVEPYLTAEPLKQDLYGSLFFIYVSEQGYHAGSYTVHLSKPKCNSANCHNTACFLSSWVPPPTVKSLASFPKLAEAIVTQRTNFSERAQRLNVTFNPTSLCYKILYHRCWESWDWMFIQGVLLKAPFTYTHILVSPGWSCVNTYWIKMKRKLVLLVY